MSFFSDEIMDCPYCGVYIFGQTKQEYVKCPRCGKKFKNTVDWDNLFKNNKNTPPFISKEEMDKAEEALKELALIKRKVLSIIGLICTLCILPLLIYYPNFGVAVLVMDIVFYFIVFLISLLDV